MKNSKLKETILTVVTFVVVAILLVYIVIQVVAPDLTVRVFGFKPYLVVGGGFDVTSAEDKTYISEYGFEIRVEPPESTTDALASFGAGVNYSVSGSIGIRLDVRYVLIFTKPQNIRGLNGVLGLFFQF